MSTADKPDYQMALAQVVKNMRENLPAHLEYAALQAKLTRARYRALIEQGFTEEQAMQLCWRS